MFVLSPLICREPCLGDMFLKFNKQTLFNGQGFKAALMVEKGIESNYKEYQSNSVRL